MPVARLVLALLLLAMAAGQILSSAEFQAAVDDYSVTGATVVVVVLLAGEVVGGVGLLLPLPRTRVVAGWIGLAVALLWTGLALQAFARGLQIDNCGCFGRFLAQELSWWVLVQDAYFVALAGLALRNARTDLPGQQSTWRSGQEQRVGDSNEQV